MCGIAGICQIKAPGVIRKESLKRMVQVLNHRGPDERGIYLDDRVGLGHARLSIIDLHSGIQPIHNEDQTLWLVYNGEVFNYPELRSDLLERGHRFYTNTDSEVILHLYETFGAQCLERLRGQFAFALWDNARNELFLARDHVGIRPLYYTEASGRLLFASEVKALFVHPEVERSIDPRALDQIFTFWTTLPGHTAFQGICEVPPGHYLKLSRGRFRMVRYWDIPLPVEHASIDLSADEIIEEVRHLLHDAVRMRLRADVPVGAYLSGGLDSTGVTSLVVNDFNHEVNTFGIRFDEADFDESDFQQEAVAYLKTRHQALTVNSDRIGENFSEVIRHCEKPILRTAPVPLFLLSRQVRDSGLKVVLTGEGADEIFCGYNIFKEAKIRAFWARRPGSRLRPLLIGRLYPYIFKDPRQKTYLQSFFAKSLTDVDHPFYSHLIRWKNTEKLKTFFSANLKEILEGYDPYAHLMEFLPRGYPEWDKVARAQYLETALFMSNYLLSSQGDRVAMAHSVEIRLPYLDKAVMEFMGRVPSRMKIFGLNEKYLLKKAFTGRLPASIIGREKHPYRAPIGRCLLKAEDGNPAAELLSESAVRETGFFDPLKVSRLVKKLKAAPRSGEIDSMGLAGILSTQILHRRFIARPPVPESLSGQVWHEVDKRSAPLLN